MKKIGVFSDLHGDRQSLDLIVKTFHNLEVDSAMFLGDVVYQTMSDFTNTELNKAYQVKEQLLQESKLRDDFLDGLFSDQQLQRYLELSKKAASLSRKIAKAEYTDLKKALAGLDLAVLGGNWDYPEIQDVFGKDYLQAASKQVGGLNVTGFSGGGSPSPLTARDQTLCDYLEPKAQLWAERLLSKEPLDADVLISHLPFVDGKGVHNEPGVQQLKKMVQQRKKAGLDTPELYMWGHQHGSGDVTYNSELEGFTVNPGSSSRNHNHNLPTFMVCDFDENNKLCQVDKYQILAALDGLSEVRLVGKYELGDKKVNFKELSQIVHEEKDPLKFKNNLHLDSAYGVKLNVDYAEKTAEEKDLMLRKNLSRVKEITEDTEKRVKEALLITAKKCFTSGGKIVNCSLERTVEEVRVQLAEQARQLFRMGGLGYRNEQEKIFWEEALVRAAFKLDSRGIAKALAKPKQYSDLVDFGKDLVEKSGERIGAVYQNHILKSLSGYELQQMAELYLPAAYSRRTGLNKEKSLGLWMASYQNGLITSEIVDSTGAYQKGKTIKRSNESLDKLLGIEQKADDQSEPSEAEINKWVGQQIREGKIPVIEKDGKQYFMAGPDKYFPLNQPEEFGLKQGDYKVISPEQFMQNQAT
ncbi:MAG: metallophosphoesterase, partial [Candidatus Woesearchaeota archaeon]